MMMGEMDKSPIPAYAVTLWSDDNHIYAALPMTTGGLPFIQRYALTESGLREALAVLKARRREVITPTLDAPANYTLPANQPMVKRVMSKSQERLYAETTEAQRESARRVLAKLGIK